MHHDNRYEDGDYSTGTVADYEDWLSEEFEPPRHTPTRFELHGMGHAHRTTFSATEARRWLQSGRNLARGAGTFGRTVICVRPNPDGDTPFRTVIYPKEYR